MSKTLRIFAKDTRHLWPEILLTLAVTFAFATLEPHSWSWHAARSLDGRRSDRNGAMLEQLRFIVGILLPIAWWLIIARSVQDESLVGDRQFWVTRPYGWPRILIAKILFVGVFVVLPLFAAKLWLVQHAGLSISESLLPVVLNTLAMACTLLLLFFTLSTVTSSIVRMFFVALGAALFIALCTYLNTSLFPSTQTFGPDGTPAWLSFIPVLTCVAVILVQYAFRRTALSRAALIGVTLFFAIYLSVHDHTWSVARVYKAPPAGQPAPFTFAVDTARIAAPHGEEQDTTTKSPQTLLTTAQPAIIRKVDGTTASRIGYTTDDTEKVLARRNGRIYIPLTAIVPLHHTVVVDNVVARYSLPGHAAGSSDHFFSNEPHQSGSSPDAIYIELGEGWDAYKDQQLSVHLTVAVTDYEELDTRVIPLGRHVKMPHQGRCEFNLERALADSCIFAVGAPSLTSLTTRYSNELCGTVDSPGYEVTFWEGYGGDNTWNVEPDPVLEIPLRTYSEGAEHYFDGQNERHRQLCKGQPVQVTSYRQGRRYLLQIDLPPLTPSRLVATQLGTLTAPFGR